jgi:hypothetical protein
MTECDFVETGEETVYDEDDYRDDAWALDRDMGDK